MYLRDNESFNVESVNQTNQKGLNRIKTKIWSCSDQWSKVASKEKSLVKKCWNKKLERLPAKKVSNDQQQSNK